MDLITADDGHTHAPSASVEIGGELLNTFKRHAHEACPAFSIGQGAPGQAAEIGVQWDEHYRILMHEGEVFAGRWLCAPILCRFTVSESGLPLEASTANVTGELSPGAEEPAEGQVQAFFGSGPVEVTSRRLVGTVGEGDSIFGDLYNPASGGERLLAFALPLSEISMCVLRRERGLLRTKAMIVLVATRTGGFLLLQAVGEGKKSGPASTHDLMTGLVQATVAVRRPTARPEIIHSLDRAAKGEWLADGDDRGVWFDL